MVDRNVTYRLRGDANDFTRVVNRAEATLSGSFRKMQQSSSRGARAVAGDYEAIARAAGGAELKVKGLVTSIAGFAIGGAGLGAIFSQVTASADEIAKAADRLGVATEELQRYHYAAELSGIQTREFDVAFQRFGRRIGEVAQGFGEARGAIQSLNIDVKNIDGTLRPVNQVFDEAVQKLSQIEDVTLRNALAAKLFDSEGVKLVQLGNQILALKAQADDDGVIISDDDLTRIEGFNDAMTKFKTQLQRAITVAIAKFVPTVEKAASVLGVVADNFEEVVAAIATFAKLLVAIKLAGFIQAMYGVATASVAAAAGVNALRISLQGLKAATFIGLGLIALEIAIKKFLDAVDDTDEIIEESMNNAVAAVEDGGDRLASAYDDVSSELIQQRQAYNDSIDDLVKAEIKSLEDGLKAQEQVVRDQKRLLNEATRDAEKAAKEFQDAFDQIRGKNAKIETPDLIDFAGEITRARQLLDQGDNEGAVEAALRAKDVVLALQETGNYTQAQLEGTLKKAQEVQQAASGALVAEQEAVVSQAETALEKIQSQINLIKSISFDFDETKSLEAAQQVLNQIKTLIANQPIVVPVELRPVNGIDAGSVSAPGFATGGYITGPGTTTSDSILARLSRGEYVIRAAAVQKYGLDFLNKLNAGRIQGYASGGLVRAPAGGSGSGTPINLSFGGQSFPMTASPEVAAQLRRETYHEQLKKGRRG